MKQRVLGGLGAAVVVAGVSLGGPLPVAAADDANADSTVEAQSQTPGPAAPSRRPARSRSAAESTAKATVAATPAPRAGQVRNRSAAVSVKAPGRKPAQRPAPAVTGRTTEIVPPAPASALARMRATVGTQPTPAAAETALAPPAPGLGQAPAALRRVATERSATPAFPVRGRAASMAAVNLEHALDTVGSWLSGRGNPFTDVLAGGLWLVRRTLFPVGADVGLWGSAACVATKDCSGQDLTGADFTGQDLTAVNFTNAVLKWARFTDATLVKATLTGVSDADLISATWLRADLSGQDFSGRSLFINPTLTAINFSRADLTDAKFIGTYLVRADFRGSVLTRADLSTSRLVGARFFEATLVDANLSGVVASVPPRTRNTNFVEANLTGADLTDAKLVRTNLDRANLTDANLTRADLTEAALGRTVLTGVTWKNTTCPDGSKTDTGCSV